MRVLKAFPFTLAMLASWAILFTVVGTTVDWSGMEGAITRILVIPAYLSALVVSVFSHSFDVPLGFPTPTVLALMMALGADAVLRWFRG